MGEKNSAVWIVVVLAVLGIVFLWWRSTKAKAAAAGTGGIGGTIRGAANAAENVTNSASNTASSVGGTLVKVQEGIVNTFTLGGYNTVKGWF